MAGDGYLSASHRSREVRREIQRTDEGLRALLEIPPEWRVLLVGSATEAMERILESSVRGRSLHLVNGAFSRRFFTVAENLRLHPVARSLPDGEGFGADALAPSDLTFEEEEATIELLALTQNETSTGARIQPEDLHQLADQGRKRGWLVAVDLVTGWPQEPIDVSRIDAGFFSVQKGFGLPSGLGVLIASPALLERARTRAGKGERIGGYLHLSALAEAADRFETVATPNTLAIRLLGRVTEAYLNAGGQKGLQHETERGFEDLWAQLSVPIESKATLNQPENGSGHSADEGSGNEPRDNAGITLRPFVSRKDRRSRTVAVISVESEGVARARTGAADSPLPAAALRAELLRRGFEVGTGYGQWKDRHIRIANFPVHTPTLRAAMLDALLEAVRTIRG